MLHPRSFPYRLLFAAGVTPMAKRLRRRAAEFGYALNFRYDRIVLRSGDREIWYPAQEAGCLWMTMHLLREMEPRFVFSQRGTTHVADLRGEQRYRIPSTGDFVSLPGMIESADVVAGYFARGGPLAGELAFDCGAYCGEVSIALARKVGPAGRVVSFEPDASSRTRLLKNLRAAGLANVTVVEKGLWKETTTLSFEAGGDLCSHLSSGQPSATAFQVPVIGFEEACELAGGVPSFVKMDIEGAEVETIEGSINFIAKQSIRFAIASYHQRDGEPTWRILEPLFRQAGYQVESGYPEHLTTWAWKG